MIQSSTSDQLLLLAYGELNGAEASALLVQISSDPAIAAEWDAIKQLTSELSDTTYAPSETSLKIVLEHSYKTEHMQEI
jgi:hypothetical protein